MKAMILAAGLGTRLGALTKETPKCLVPVAGKPIIVYVIERLRAVGVTSVVINLHYLADRVRKYFSENSFGVGVEFTYEPEILNTGGGIRNARALLESESDFIVHNCDVYSEIDLADLLRAHRENKALATLAVLDIPAERALLFDAQDSLVGWESKENTEQSPSAAGLKRLSFTGIQVLSRPIFKYLEKTEGPCASLRVYLDAVRAVEKVHAYRADGKYWLDMGTPKDLEVLRARIEGQIGASDPSLDQ